MSLPLLPLEKCEELAREIWLRYWLEDADYSDHRSGWDSLKSSAIDLGVSVKGFKWNSRESKRKLARKLMKMKLYHVRKEWSEKVSTGKYRVLA